MYRLQQQHDFKSQCDKLRMDLRPSVQQQYEWLYITTDEILSTETLTLKVSEG